VGSIGYKLAEPNLERVLLVEHDIECSRQMPGFSSRSGRCDAPGPSTCRNRIGHFGDFGNRTQSEPADPESGSREDSQENRPRN